MLEWRSVVGWEGVYEVSAFGDVRSARTVGNTHAGRWLKPALDKSGYCRVFLADRKRERTVPCHVLVAEAFIGPRPQDAQINHQDTDKSNNHFSNLEYVTPEQHRQHTFSRKLHLRGERATCVKLTAEQVLEIRRLAAMGWSQKTLASIYPVNKSTISHVVTRRIWKHVGADSVKPEA